MVFLVYGSNSWIRSLGLISYFILGVVFDIGYLYAAYQKPFWLPPRILWAGTILYNIFFLIAFGNFVMTQLWIVVLWPSVAIVLASIMLSRTR